MLLAVLSGFVRETYRLFIDISPYLLIGFLFAGLLHTLFGEKLIRRHFSRSGLASIFKASLFGVPLPVCSCGVIPLAESLRRDGASKSSTMAFLVSTPTSGIDSILATYALMGPIFAIFRPIAAFVSGIFVGSVTHLATKKDKDQVEIHPHSGNGETGGKKSFKQAFYYGFKVLPSELAGWLTVGVLIGGVISALVPADFGQRYLHSPFLAYLVILLISIPIYVCATGSIPIAASLMAKGVLPGAALAFLIAGPATNTVTISFVYKRLGRKIAILYVISIAVVAVISGLIFDSLWTGSSGDGGLIAAGGEFIPNGIKIASAVLMILVLLNSRFDLNRLKTRNRNNLQEIIVPDMNCPECQLKVNEALTGMPGIKTVLIDLKRRKVAVDTTLGREQLLDRLKSAGYHPE